MDYVIDRPVCVCVYKKDERKLWCIMLDQTHVLMLKESNTEKTTDRF